MSFEWDSRDRCLVRRPPPPRWRRLLDWLLGP
jgi:hypothetical protein